MSGELADRTAFGLQQLERLLQDFSPLIARGSERELDTIETAAVASMLHSFYTEIEKILKRIAQDVDGHVPSAEFWHRDLLDQMQISTKDRIPVISAALAERLKEYLAFRHLFRGASVALMRWPKMRPLAEEAAATYRQFNAEVLAFLRSRTA